MKVVFLHIRYVEQLIYGVSIREHNEDVLCPRPSGAHNVSYYWHFWRRYSSASKRIGSFALSLGLRRVLHNFLHRENRTNVDPHMKHAGLMGPGAPGPMGPKGQCTPRAKARGPRAFCFPSPDFHSFFQFFNVIRV